MAKFGAYTPITLPLADSHPFLVEQSPSAVLNVYRALASAAWTYIQGKLAGGAPVGMPVRVVTAPGAVAVVAGDGMVVVNKTVGAATTVNLEATPATGVVHVIKDGKGDSAANPITVTPNSGNIDGAGTLVIASAYAAVSVALRRRAVEGVLMLKMMRKRLLGALAAWRGGAAIAGLLLLMGAYAGVIMVGQGSTTSGQPQILAACAATTGAPTDTTADTWPLSCTTAGGVRVDGSGATQPVSGTVAATESGSWTANSPPAADARSWRIPSPTSRPRPSPAARRQLGVLLHLEPQHLSGVRPDLRHLRLGDPRLVDPEMVGRRARRPGRQHVRHAPLLRQRDPGRRDHHGHRRQRAVHGTGRRLRVPLMIAGAMESVGADPGAWQSSRRRLSWNRKHFLVGPRGLGVIIARPLVRVHNDGLIINRRGFIPLALTAAAMGGLLLDPREAYASSYTYAALLTPGTGQHWTSTGHVVAAQAIGAGSGPHGGYHYAGGGGAAAGSTMSISGGVSVQYCNSAGGTITAPNPANDCYFNGPNFAGAGVAAKSALGSLGGAGSSGVGNVFRSSGGTGGSNNSTSNGRGAAGGPLGPGGNGSSGLNSHFLGAGGGANGGTNGGAGSSRSPNVGGTGGNSGSGGGNRRLSGAHHDRGPRLQRAQARGPARSPTAARPKPVPRRRRRDRRLTAAASTASAAAPPTSPPRAACSAAAPARAAPRPTPAPAARAASWSRWAAPPARATWAPWEWASSSPRRAMSASEARNPSSLASARAPDRGAARPSQRPARAACRRLSPAHA